MYGIEGGNEQGIIPRTIHTLFEIIEQSSKIKASLSVSCLEIYQEKLFDLLNENNSKLPNSSDIPLRIRQTTIGSVWVEVIFISTSNIYLLLYLF